MSILPYFIIMWTSWWWLLRLTREGAVLPRGDVEDCHILLTKPHGVLYCLIAGLRDSVAHSPLPNYVNSTESHRWTTYIGICIHLCLQINIWFGLLICNFTTNRNLLIVLKTIATSYDDFLTTVFFKFVLYHSGQG